MHKSEKRRKNYVQNSVHFVRMDGLGHDFNYFFHFWNAVCFEQEHDILTWGQNVKT